MGSKVLSGRRRSVTGPVIATLSAVSCLSSAGPASAYLVYPDRPVHEAMTHLSYECWEADRNRESFDCRAYYNQLSRASWYWPVRDFTPEQKASSWPDDPMREIAPLTIARWGFAIKVLCPSLRSGETAPGFTLAEGGLVCSSHYGSLQFMHAMKSYAGEDAADARSRMLDWADFTYQVATGRISLDEDYCSRVRSLPGSTISDALAGPDFPGCSERTENGRTRPAWRVRTLFASYCSGVFSAEPCGEIPGERGAALARRNAMGALFHLIQDSYSQSHAIRGPGRGDGTFISVVDCSPPEDFLFYRVKDSSAHGRADAPPTTTRNCESPHGATDAISAGAKVIALIQENAQPDKLRSFMVEEVFAVPVAPA